MTLLLHVSAARMAELLANGLIAAAAVLIGIALASDTSPTAVPMLVITAAFLIPGLFLARSRRIASFTRSRGLPLLLAALIAGLAGAWLVERLFGGGHLMTPATLGLGFLLGATALTASSILPGVGVGRLLHPPLNGGRVLIVGNNRRTLDLLEKWQLQARGRVEIVGYLDALADSDPARRNPAQDLLAFLGDTSSIGDTLRRNVIDEVWVTLPLGSHYREIERVIQVCETVGVAVRLPGSAFEHESLPVRGGDGSQVGEIYYQSVAGSSWHFVAKRSLDVFGSALLLVVLSPLLIAVSALIKLTSRGPALYGQVRCGLHGRRFTMYKFRSMVVGADRQLESLRERNEASGPVFKMRKDPRVTRIGSFLRRTSIDELPQLINVLKGDMSLVGPRPPVPDEVDRYLPWQLRRLSVPPGLTCVWQVSGRSTIPFDEWMRMDLDYVAKWSLWRDLGLLFRTIPAVLSRRGAS